MTQRHRLRGLQVGKARHDGRMFPFCQFQQAFQELPDAIGQLLDAVPQVESYIGCHLVIA